MNTFMYISNKSTVESITAATHFENAQVVTENRPLAEDWRDRVLNDILTSAKKGDRIVVLDAPSLARSHTQVLSFLEATLQRGVHVHFTQYQMAFKAEPNCNFYNLLTLVSEIEKDFSAQRNHDLLIKRKELGIALGRPKGRKNKSLKLDKYKRDIDRYLQLSISKASISKLIDCHPQTLYDWIERNEADIHTPHRVHSKKKKQFETFNKKN